MDIKGLTGKIKQAVLKYKYPAIVLAVGLALLLIPGKTAQKTETQIKPEIETQTVPSDALAQILESIEGAGKVQVMLSVATGEKTIYQTDTDVSASGDSTGTKTETVIITDSQRSEAGLISQIDPPTYLGAIVVCQGADSAAVRFDVTQAVSKITGLGSDKICVLKMK